MQTITTPTPEPTLADLETQHRARRDALRRERNVGEAWLALARVEASLRCAGLDL